MVIGLLKGHDAAIKLAEHAELNLAETGISQITLWNRSGMQKLPKKRNVAFLYF